MIHPGLHESTQSLTQTWWKSALPWPLDEAFSPCPEPIPTPARAAAAPGSHVPVIATIERRAVCVNEPSLGN